MRIKRVDEKTVKCFLTNEELEAYEIEYKDFIMHSDKARQVVQEILEQAAVEVGYKPPQFAFDLQIMVLQDQGILLTLSESNGLNGHARQLLDCLKDMQQTLQQSKEQLDMLDAAVGAGVSANGEEALAAVPSENKAQPVVTKSEQAIFTFDSIHDVMEYAAVLPANLRVQSALYEMKDRYYLYLNKGGAAYERFSRACIQAMEFGRLYSAKPDQRLLLEEHGSCLIEERAIQKMRG